MKHQRVSAAVRTAVRGVVVCIAAGTAGWIGKSQPVVAQGVPTSAKSVCAVLGAESGDQTLPQEANDPETARALPGARMGCLMNRARWGSVMAVAVFATPQAACDQVETLRRTVGQAPGRRVQLAAVDIGSRGVEAYEPTENNDQIWFCRGVFFFAGAGVVGSGQMTRAQLADYARAVDQRCRAFTGSDEVAWTFHAYANNVKALAPLRFDYQLGVSMLSGGGQMRDGRYSGTITDFDVQATTGTRRFYTAEVLGGALKTSAQTVSLTLNVRVILTSDPRECPVGATGVVELQDSPALMANGNDYDFAIIGSWTGGCDGHIHGWNNEDPGPRTSPPTGGAPAGGQWAIVDIVKR